MERVFGCDSGTRARLLEARHFDRSAMAEGFADDARLDLLTIDAMPERNAA